MYEILAVLAVIGVLYVIFSGLIERTWLSGPTIFIGLGVLVGPLGLGMIKAEDDWELLMALAELTLALVLFTDAAETNLKVLLRVHDLPVRMLAIGLPLTIGLGFLTGWLLFPDWPLLELALLATILAPTDAALGKPVLANEDVPETLRESLNVESGLNDGICVPILFLFLDLIAGESSGKSPVEIGLHHFIEEVGIGVVVALIVTGAASWLLQQSRQRNWMSDAWSPVLVVGLALACFGVAQAIGGSGFIASFVGGILFGIFCKSQKKELIESAEGIGNTFAYLTWILFGAMVVSMLFGKLTVPVVAYSLLSLTVVRMLPIFLSVTGLVKSVEQRLFLGWFGPRGLASIVFVIIVITRNLEIESQDSILTIVACTVTLSVLLHGVTANPWAARIGRQA